MKSTSADRLENLVAHAPFYARLIDKHIDYHAWLERPENLLESYRYSAFTNNWLEHFLPAESPSAQKMQTAIKRFRQKMALRIAYRDINQLSNIENTLRELSLLAEVCVQISSHFLNELWLKRLGTPMNEETQQPARFCILGMGKLGGHELNFWSDIDLIYFFDGIGLCHKHGNATQVSTQEYYHRFFRDLSSFLNNRSNDGALYNLDLRLRPEGNAGPIARSYDSMESYYWERGEPWERLAFVRARPIAGDTALGAELLEQLTPFTYPRFPQSSIFQEIAGVKLRIEREIIGTENRKLDIKSGFGGIREIEYQVQALQITQGGRNPFLQTPSTLEALDQLEKYNLLSTEKAHFLRDAYLTLRHIENRLQMKDEMQVHTLPPAGVEREKLALGLGYASEAVFSTTLNDLRQQVHTYYLELFETGESETEIQEWTLLFAGKAASSSIQKKLEQWFPQEDNTVERLMKFAVGSTHQLITREQVILFIEVTRYFDELLPQLATPLKTLERVARFAESYGARKHFFKTATDQQYFSILCLLFDSSPFVHKLLCRNPEIMEELLYESPGRKKSFDEIQNEISKLPDDQTFPQLLWLYIKAEQVRLAMGELTKRITINDVEERLTTLADAAVSWVLKKFDPDEHLAIVALGKYGGRQLEFGSDLDLLVLGEQNTLATDQPILRQIIKVFRYQDGLGHTLELDLRLRPHGNDSPLITTMHAIENYHNQGYAHIWEKQLLTRHRPIAGNSNLLQQFDQFVHQQIYKQAIKREEIDRIWAMRLKAEKEKCSRNMTPQRAIKTGPGGLMDIEFLAQLLQLKFGYRDTQLRLPNTRSVLQAAQNKSLIASIEMDSLLEKYSFLRRIEFYLRRLEFSSNSVLLEDLDTENALAKWMNFDKFDDMFMRVATCMQSIRNEINQWLNDHSP